MSSITHYVCHYSIKQKSSFVWCFHFWMSPGIALYLSQPGSSCQGDDERTVMMPRKGSGGSGKTAAYCKADGLMYPLPSWMSLAGISPQRLTEKTVVEEDPPFIFKLTVLISFWQCFWMETWFLMYNYSFIQKNVQGDRERRTTAQTKRHLHTLFCDSVT